MKKPFSIRSRMNRLVATMGILVAAILATVLVLIVSNNNHYARLLYNVTTASEFNRDF